MTNIFQTLVYQREKKKDTVLATIIWDDGSAPRGKGSQMLVGAEGLLAGTIGGGAVELKSIQLSQELLTSGGSGFIREFRLSRDGELGMACGGDVTVLFSPARLEDGGWDETAAEVLRRETAYVGVIGSRKKTAYVNQRLREAGIPEEKIAFVHTPIGTAIKAVTPEEIAVSIAGEMICVRATRREAAGEVHHGCPMH